MSILLVLLSMISLGDFSTLPESEKEALVGQVHQVRGFTHQTSDGGWLLSSEPKLSSCCVGSAKKASCQILLPECSFSAENTLVVMEGSLVAQNDEKDVKRFALTEAKEIRRKTTTLYFSILAVLIFAVGYLFWRRFAKSS